jgi:hypothetical protein
MPLNRDCDQAETLVMNSYSGAVNLLGTAVRAKSSDTPIVAAETVSNAVFNRRSHFLKEDVVSKWSLSSRNY